MFHSIDNDLNDDDKANPKAQLHLCLHLVSTSRGQLPQHSGGLRYLLTPHCSCNQPYRQRPVSPQPWFRQLEERLQLSNRPPERWVHSPTQGFRLFPSVGLLPLQQTSQRRVQRAVAGKHVQRLLSSHLPLVARRSTVSPQTKKSARYLASLSKGAGGSRTSTTSAFGNPVTTSLAVFGAPSAFGARESPCSGLLRLIPQRLRPLLLLITSARRPRHPYLSKARSRTSNRLHLPLVLYALLNLPLPRLAPLHLKHPSQRSNSVYGYVETCNRIPALTSTASDLSVIEATYKPGSTPYDALLPADAEYVSLSPAEVQEASKSDKFE